MDNVTVKVVVQITQKPNAGWGDDNVLAKSSIEDCGCFTEAELDGKLDSLIDDVRARCQAQLANMRLIKDIEKRKQALQIEENRA